MKKKISILGSTGSIGKTLLDLISKDRKNFEIILLTADTNYKLLYKQAKKFNVKIIEESKEEIQNCLLANEKQESFHPH